MAAEKSSPILEGKLMKREQFKIPTLAELQAIRYKENGDTLVQLEESDRQILCEYRRRNSNVKGILVRQSLVDKLGKVQQRLSSYDTKLKLLVVEGYRSPAYQECYFLQQLLLQQALNPARDQNTLVEAVHQLVALPSVAGHPTGGAIDVTLSYDNREVDMGGAIADFSLPDLMPTHSSLATAEQRRWRLCLHDLMIAEGFAPFYGEW